MWGAIAGFLGKSGIIQGLASNLLGGILGGSNKNKESSNPLDNIIGNLLGGGNKGKSDLLAGIFEEGGILEKGLNLLS